MKTMLWIGRTLLVAALAIFLFGTMTLFWPATQATISTRGKISLRQNGYSGVHKPSTKTFTGSTTTFSTVRYHYQVSGTVYEGTGITNTPQYETIKIFYSPSFPSLSVTKNGIQLPWIILLATLGACILQTRKWLLDIVNRGP